MIKIGQKEQLIHKFKLVHTRHVHGIQNNWCTQDTCMIYGTLTLVQMGLVQQCIQVICTNWFSVTGYTSYQLQLVE